MNYAKITNGTPEFYPSSIEKLVALGVLSSNTPTEQELNNANVVQVLPCSEGHPKNEFIYELKPVQQQDGTWAASWVKVEATEWQMQGKAESVANAAIAVRNQFLTSSDWTQLPDVTIANKPAWAVYRQALRDITAQSGFPFNINWPTRP